eukprot:CAMPEP_0118637082 /NCGR_PEP_ID=MMETSP0785-20121206/2966_1 /TAXON_ID=91992 /ORGANISM="Bolidomonas pacifica, Strain CCMP 1866" /LENGTH=63 /DNA_ID=CAMNT_0006528251 /DNA_START=461 /DNA_END=653 /DNA_ORIENTATION=+
MTPGGGRPFLRVIPTDKNNQRNVVNPAFELLEVGRKENVVSFAILELEYGEEYEGGGGEGVPA